MASVRDWEAALERVEASALPLGDPAEPGRLEGQKAALAALEACLAEGVAELDPGRRPDLVRRVRSALAANGQNLNWTRLRAQHARIGVKVPAPAKRGAGLDIIS